MAALGFHALFRKRKALPTWALGTHLRDLQLRVRTYNVFRTARFQRLSDVLEAGESRVSALRNFGLQSQCDFASCVHRLLIAGEVRTVPSRPLGTLHESDSPTVAPATENSDAGVQEDTAPLWALLHKALAALSPRDAVVLRRWLGLGCERTTMTMIAGEMKLTRERVRQLRERALDRAVMSQRWARSIRQRVISRLSGRAVPLYVDILATEDPWFLGFESECDALGRLIAFVFSDGDLFWYLEGRALLSTCRESEWEKLRKQASDVADACAARRSTRDAVPAAIKRTAVKVGALDLALELCRVTSIKLQYGSDSRLLSTEMSLRALVSAILASSPIPLSLDDIMARAVERGAVDVRQTSCRGVLGSCGAHVFSGRRYGLDKHIPLDAATMNALARVAEAIVRDGPSGRQWHCAELLGEIQSVWMDVPDIVDKYVLHATLLRARRLVSLGRFVWRKGRSMTPKTSERLSLASLAARALRDAGHPLTKAGLRKAVARRRGVSDGWMTNLNLSDTNMAKLEPGLWGLVDRDFDTNAAEQQVLLDGLFRSLSARGAGLHYSELPALLPLCHERTALVSGFAILGLARRDPRFRVRKGWLISLATWPDARRLSLTGALRQLAQSRRYYREFAALHSDIEHVMKRSVSEIQCRSALAAEGYSFSAAAGLVRGLDSA